MATKSAVDIKSILGGCSGNLIEWYDWYAFAAFSIYFSGQFFPNQSPTIQLLNTAAIFATGFLMRPIGSYVMGVIADKHGRKNALTLSVLLMSLGSFLIAILPTQKTIGILAPILLTFIRLLQGFSLGGEYGISATYICEISNRKNRGFYSSFLYVTLIGGHLLAITVQVILQIFFLTDDQLKSWGWRIPFFIGSLLSLYVFYLRRKLVETESFISEELSHDVKPVSIFKNPKVFFFGDWYFNWR